MSDYKYQPITGTAWHRFAGFRGENPYGGAPSIVYHEYRAENKAGTVESIAVGALSQTMTAENEGTIIPLVNSEDWDQPMPQAYKDELIAAIQSGGYPLWALYQFHASHVAKLAAERDAAAAAGG